jgi:phospholipid-translocating P-type ATPase (flippase)
MSENSPEYSSRELWANCPELNKGFTDNKVVTTKYNVLTFLPFSLFIQFRRVSNIYFLITAILQSIPQISPLSSFTAITPLVFVLGVSMIREGIEDYLRYKSDKEINKSPTMIYDKGSFKTIPFCQIKVGDIVFVKKNQVFPCDLVMLSNSSTNGTAYIETSSIDGEKALKSRQAFGETAAKYKKKNINRIMNKINCEHPNARLYNFSGSYEINKKLYRLDKSNLLLAGAFLRNTKWIIGVSVYTGKDTKLRQNMMNRKYKESFIDKTCNGYIAWILFLQFCMCIAAAIGSGIWVSNNIMTHTYIRYDPNYTIYNQGGTQGVLSYFTYFLLLNTMLPISLIITLEFLKLTQGFFMMMDLNMYSSKRDRCCKVSSFSLNEELGMIKHIFSDKTGTLTCNQMEFKFFCTGNRIYGDQASLVNIGLKSKVTYEDREIKFTFNDDRVENDLFHDGNKINLTSPLRLELDKKIISYTTQQEITAQMVKCMALCHECLIEVENNEIKYIGPSPDDVVLVDAAKRFGYQLACIKSEIMTLDLIEFKVHETKTSEEFKRICILEFNSDRKRMSVVLQELKTGRFLIFTKGADSVMFKRLSKSYNDPKYINSIQKYVETFSSRGFRTLVMSFKYIDSKVYSDWKDQYDIASTKIVGRDEAVSELAEKIETDMILLGCTSVEDSLQEDVPSTIKDLLTAGISFWMLTGDKLETAENIGRTCSLIDENMHVERCSSEDPEDCFNTISKILKNFKAHQKEKQLALIIEGPALEVILYNHADLNKREKHKEISLFADNVKYALDSKGMFLEIADICKTIICCRVSPGEKKEVVKLIKDTSGKITLSIGDGANDVPMILEAHIGVGLYGEEGIQAVQASDYALGEFRYLWELLLVHGRFNYMRQSEMILYFFYKNLVFTVPQFLYAHYCGYSGQTIYDEWYLAFYNLFFTALPLFIRALFERDFDVPKRWESVGENAIDSKKSLRRIIPLTYSLGRDNQLFTLKRFLLWMYTGFLHSFIVFFVPFYAAEEGIFTENGLGYDIWSFSISSFTCIIIIVNLKLALNTRLWNVFHFIAIFGLSIAIYIVFILIYDLFTYTSSFRTVYTLIGTYYYYLSIICTIFLVCVLDLGLTFANTLLFPNDSDVLAYNTFSKSSKVGADNNSHLGSSRAAISADSHEANKAEEYYLPNLNIGQEDEKSHLSDNRDEDRKTVEKKLPGHISAENPRLYRLDIN